MEKEMLSLRGRHSLASLSSHLIPPAQFCAVGKQFPHLTDVKAVV